MVPADGQKFCLHYQLSQAAQEVQLHCVRCPLHLDKAIDKILSTWRPHQPRGGSEMRLLSQPNHNLNLI